MSRLIYLLFFLSGIAGLMYEIVWGRMLVVIFGSTTNSIVAVVSAFLGGLAIGSLIFGRVADKLSAKKLINLYSLLELGVGLTGGLTLILIPQVRIIYSQFSDGSSQTLLLLIIKFILTIGIILIPTILMGGTLPILVRFLQTQKQIPDKIVSWLYAINTFGGALGVVLAAFILIELVGLQQTILIAASVNILISLLARLLSTQKILSTTIHKTTLPLSTNPKFTLAFVGFALSGMISIAYQILWTRALTPALGTVIYAFASILVIYLIGIAIGSLIFNRFIKFVRSPILGFAICELGIGLFAFISVIAMHKFKLSGEWELYTRVLPTTIFMGLTFPVITSVIQDKNQIGKAIGIIYFGNTIGAIIGGFLASFILIPYLGTSQGIVMLTIINFLIALVFFLQDKVIAKKIIYGLRIFTIFLIISTSWLMIYKRDRLYPLKVDFSISDAQLRQMDYGYKEDDVASVFGIKDTKNNELHLVIDGVETTHRVTETRLMAHLPLALNPKSQDALIIAFGMGTSYKSMLKHNINTTAIELVPSVPTFMHLFHPDADQFLNHPKGKVIINDGRNFAFLTKHKYDIVIIDPPPPFNTAGSTVLHSKEFYQDLSKNLKPNGIVSQWIYYDRSREDEISMAIKSFVETFPNVLAVHYVYNIGGLFLEGSYSPLDPSKVDNILKDSTSKTDLAEIMGPEINNPEFKMMEVVGNRNSLLSQVKAYPPISDNNPRSEYYLLRHKFTQSPTLVNQDAKNFVNKLRSSFQLNK